MKSTLFAGAFATTALAASGPWQQCGGRNWSGETTCVSGYYCSFNNEWYSQCIPGAGPTTLKTSTTSAATPISTSSSAPAATSSTAPSKKFKWFGINQSCAEFGQDTYPGVWGKHFTFPSTSSIQVRKQNRG